MKAEDQRLRIRAEGVVSAMRGISFADPVDQERYLFDKILRAMKAEIYRRGGSRAASGKKARVRGRHS